MNPVVFYDGECNFCNHWVQWIIECDAEKIFRFASLQSEFAKNMFSHFGEKKNFDTLSVYTDKGEFLTKSRAVSYILKRLKVQTFFSGIIKIAPRFLSDIGYDIIAGFRKRLQNNCRIFSREEKMLFFNNREFADWYAENR